MRVSVVGASTPTESGIETARRLGRVLGRRDHTVVCGGLGGVMEAVCEGARDAGGHTIGILPGENRAAANQHVETAIATGMGHARNALVVMNGDAVIAVEGSGGTLSEVGFASVYDRPIAGLDAPDAPHVESVDTPEAAVEYVESATD